MRCTGHNTNIEAGGPGSRKAKAKDWCLARPHLFAVADGVATLKPGVHALAPGALVPGAPPPPLAPPRDGSQAYLDFKYAAAGAATPPRQQPPGLDRALGAAGGRDCARCGARFLTAVRARPRALTLTQPSPQPAAHRVLRGSSARRVPHGQTRRCGAVHGGPAGLRRLPPLAAEGWSVTSMRKQ
jgi:hypothetical protein